MSIVSRIKNIMRKEVGLPEGDMERLRSVPAPKREAEVGIVLHDICVKNAADFVKGELGRTESPFRDLPKSDFFHEMLVLNFWIFEWLFDGKRQGLMEHLYQHYYGSFVWGWESSSKELLESIRRKHRVYENAWDDYSGHQDIFARQAIGIIFGDREDVAVEQAAFWLISYTDRTMKEFAGIKRSVDLLLRKKTKGL